ncbi:phage terminase small subunit [Enterococcus sp. AZ103]|uniref:phage terminase small subunit n=1 Tax=Enterococcus sp. AZ103 TaxID=2774628 RepID=UPI003F2489B5
MDKKEQAKQMYEKGCQYKEIATSLDIPINTLKSWKKRNNWQRGGATLGVQPSSRGAPLGNENAKGNSGGGASEGNSNALKTGEYETIFLDYLSVEEREIYSSLSEDPLFILNEEIRLLKIRQRRMMMRISNAEQGLNLVEKERLYELRGRRQFIDSEKGGKKVAVEVPQMQITEKREKEVRKIEDILRIEEALTRISNALTKSIKQLKELELADKKAELTGIQIAKMKNDMGYDSDNPESIVIVDAWSDSDE